MSKNFLALDYGTTRIGVAMNMASLVEPLFVINHDAQSSNGEVSQEVLTQLQALCQEKKIDEIVLGISENDMAAKTTVFAKQLTRLLQLPVRLHDETLSSAEVQARLREAGVNLSRHQGPIDHYAAALILEDFLAIT